MSTFASCWIIAAKMKARLEFQDAGITYLVEFKSLPLVKKFNNLMFQYLNEVLIFFEFQSFPEISSANKYFHFKVNRKRKNLTESENKSNAIIAISQTTPDCLLKQNKVL